MKTDPIDSRVFSWLDQRYDLSPLIEFMRHKMVPVHRHSFWYYLGGVTLFLFIMQVLTGVLLLFYYQPGIDTGYESVQFIMTKVRFGWLFRSIHHWSSNLMILFAFVHMFSAFFSRAYRVPRELTWMSGFVLLGLSMGLGFSGYLLPWNELAFFATKVGTDIAGAIPVIGDSLKVILRGGPDVTGATLSRFYAFHVALLPAIFTVLLGLHLLFIQRQGMHEPDIFKNLPPEKKREIPFFPNFLLKDALLWLIALNILLYMAVFMPAEMGIKADAFSPAPEGIRPEWYFMFMFQTLKFIPGHVIFIEGEVLGVLFFAVIAIAWLLVPVWELKRISIFGIRPMTVIGIVAIVYIVVMTLIGYLA
jgi:quinol-cytochrome oxidoreductase complex cytochrome b subunit